MLAGLRIEVRSAHSAAPPSRVPGVPGDRPAGVAANDANSASSVRRNRDRGCAGFGVLGEGLKYVYCYGFLIEFMKNLTSTYIIRRLSELEMTAFGDVEFGRVFGLRGPQAHQVLHRLARTGLVHRIAPGRYVLGGPGEGAAMGQPFFLATRIVEPSYVGFWSALAYYGWTDQVPREVLVATTRRSGRRRIGRVAVRFVRLRPARFFGYTAVREGSLEFPLAEREKSIVDALLLPELCGGMELVAGALQEALPQLDRPKLEEYAVRTGVRSLASRLGHLLAASGADSEALVAARSRAYVKLDPRGPRRGRYDSRWRVIDNLPEGA